VRTPSHSSKKEIAMTTAMPERERAIAVLVHNACLRTLLERYEQAASDGLCAEGALEVAVSALRALDLDRLLAAEGPAARQGEGRAR
jgi:hypothetical protein